MKLQRLTPDQISATELLLAEPDNTLGFKQVRLSGGGMGNYTRHFNVFRVKTRGLDSPKVEDITWTIAEITLHRLRDTDKFCRTIGTTSGYEYLLGCVNRTVALLHSRLTTQNTPPRVFTAYQL